MMYVTAASTGVIGRVVALVASAVLMASCDSGGEELAGPEDLGHVAAPAGNGRAAVGMRSELYEFGDFTLYVPEKVGKVRGILVALGGPDTRGFASGGPFGVPVPEVEESFQVLGAMFRQLAADRGLAILGTSRAARTALPNEPASDQLLLDAVAQAASLSGRRGLVDAPFLMYGLSGGAPEASGFTARNPGRVSALFMKVPAGVAPLMTAEGLGVPTLMVLAELDAFVDNSALTAAFLAQRAADAPWALALEPGVVHHSLSPAQRELTVDWMETILGFSVDPAHSSSLHRRPATVGWLGDPATGKVAPSAIYAADRSTASWLPTRALALRWASFIGF